VVESRVDLVDKAKNKTIATVTPVRPMKFGPIPLVNYLERIDDEQLPRKPTLSVGGKTEERVWTLATTFCYDVLARPPLAKSITFAI
jgi:hypothetical protein